MYDFKRILIPMDLSECSEKALGVGLTLAARFDGRVTLLFAEDTRPGSKVWENNQATADNLTQIERAEGALHNAFRRLSNEVADKTGLPPMSEEQADFVVGAGAAAEEILRVAEEQHADLIIMGTHGRTSVRDFFVGSTTERVFKNATCAVMGVKPDGYPFLRD